MKFLLSSPQSETSTIFVRFNHRGRTFKRSTGLKIQVSGWNNKRSLPHAKNADLIRVKKKLEKLEADMLAFLNIPQSPYEIDERISQIKKDWDSPSIDTRYNTLYFWEVYEKFLQYNRAILTMASVKKYTSVKNQLERIGEDRGLHVCFGKIDLKFFDEWLKYYIDQDYSPKTAQRYWKIIKTFMKWSKQREFHQESGWEFTTPKIKNQSATKEILYLTIEEMKQMYEKQLVGMKKLVRDMFVFSCYTGLRISDIKKVRVEHIVNNAIVVDTQKDQDDVKIPFVAEILVKIIREHRFGKEKRLLFGNISDQKGNENLKKIGKEVQLDREVKIMTYESFVRVPDFKPVHKVLPWHWGRRSFVMQSIQRGMKLNEITKITGHSSVEAMKPYFAILQEDVNIAFKNAFSSHLVKNF